MKLTNLFNSDDRAVSPVIGVILMVAITVILAAVIGTFVLGLGNQVGNQAPQATWNYDYSSGGDGYSGNVSKSAAGDNVTITHQGGQSIESSSITITIGGDEVSSSSDLEVRRPFADTITAGNSTQVGEKSNDPIQSGDKVQIVWSSDSGSSSIIGSSTVPS